MPAVSKFGVSSAPIQCHAWAADRQALALSHNLNFVQVYTKSREGWEEAAVLDQHDLRVNGLDWAPRSNRIVTCIADRNAYFWVQGPDKKWKFTLVLLRINRAATCVRWSPQENKFAVGSGARIVSICYFDKENDWWVAKHIRKPLRSTVTCLDWHPNNILLATGSTDFKVRVFSTYIKEIEEKPSATEWGVKMPFANVMAEFSNSPTGGGGWIHSVCFSSDGTRISWVSHDSSIAVVDASNDMLVNKLKTNLLPFLSVLWLAPNRLLAAGHDCVPVIFHVATSGELKQGPMLEERKEAEAPNSSFCTMKMFQNKDRVGQELVDTALTTTHLNQICEMRVVSVDSGHHVESVSSCAGDGNIVIWDLNDLASKLQDLTL
jgi:actin related protein 2/3 complex subunit 1A/1B